MTSDLTSMIRRLERAQALQNERFNQAAGGTSLPLGGGFVHFRGEGHPLNQALGLIDPITEAELIEAENLLSRGGHPTILELSPGADPALWALLARRGYRVHQFQQLWVKALTEAAPPLTPQASLDSPITIRLVGVEGGPQLSQVVGAGFAGVDDWRSHIPFFPLNLAVEQAWGLLALIGGEPAGGATLGLAEGVAMLSGDATLPAFRGRGVQKALIRERLRLAREKGCDLACAGTLPSTPSQRAYEACGFRAAYPKIEMARG